MSEYVKQINDTIVEMSEEEVKAVVFPTKPN